MQTNLSVISLNDNKILLSDQVQSEADILLPTFSIKILPEKIIVVTENDKKIIVYFNEIFSLSYFEYVIIEKNNYLNLLSSFYNYNKNFPTLIQNNIAEFSLEILKNIFHIQIKNNTRNLRYFLNFIFFILIFVFLLTKNSVNHDDYLNPEKYLTQKNIYVTLQKINNVAVPEITHDSSPVLVQTDISKKELKNYLVVKKTFKATPVKEEIDNDIQYFLQMHKK
ncbi:MAG: hypothetical protein V4591_12320 [Bdellovibrionota bacterium]